jgi:pyruvate formate lyase activating enzyme
LTRGLVFDIQHFAIHDGPGIRTTVFLKGCPLRCLWCHNPEGQETAPEIFYSPEKCILCGFCAQACPDGFHTLDDAGHTFDRTGCSACGECVAECYTRALEVTGQWMTVEQVLEAVLADRDFYAISDGATLSGGGMTLSGGEPVLQYDFTRGLLLAARQAGLHTCLETSGCGSAARYRELAPLVDLFLFDLKETNPGRHRLYTGISNRQILASLRLLVSSGAEVTLRCPVIPGLNDRADHFAAIGRLAEELGRVAEIQLMPYHPLGKSKRARLGKADPLGDLPRPTEDQVRAWVAAVQGETRVRVRKG